MSDTATLLIDRPFASGLEARRFFPSAAHEEALARLDYLVQHRSRLGLLSGATGSGKSLVLEVAARSWRRAGHAVALVSLPGLSTHEFLWQLACAWQCPVLGSMPTFALWHAVSDALIVQRCEQRASLLLLDDAERAQAEVVETLERLIHLGDAQQPRLTLVLAADQRRVNSLNERLLSRAELRIELNAWDVAETRDYLQAQLQGQGPLLPVLDMPATERLHELAAGLPRRLNQLTNLVLLAAASDGLEIVDVETVDKVHRELCVSR